MPGIMMLLLDMSARPLCNVLTLPDKGNNCLILEAEADSTTIDEVFSRKITNGRSYKHRKAFW